MEEEIMNGGTDELTKGWGWGLALSGMAGSVGVFPFGMGVIGQCANYPYCPYGVGSRLGIPLPPLIGVVRPGRV